MQFVLVLHNIIRWAILIFGLWCVFTALGGLSSKREYSASDNRSNFLFMLSCDIQLLLGLILYFVNVWYEGLKTFGKTMKDPTARFFTMEHALIMIIAWILVHVGRSAVKKSANSNTKFKRTAIFFGLALLLILAAIPWPFREAIARPLLRWFN